MEAVAEMFSSFIDGKERGKWRVQGHEKYNMKS
jgi:hypothetical protein